MTQELNDDQMRAFEEMMATGFEKGERHLLEGPAGTGKTTLMQAVVAELIERGYCVAVTAPTNKAVSILAGKLAESDLDDPLGKPFGGGGYAPPRPGYHLATIHSLLGLCPGDDDYHPKLKEIGRDYSGHYRAVIIDECSMLSTELQGYIDARLTKQWVLYVGDRAQLPPVGDRGAIAQCFATKNRSTLSAIVRQTAGNPLLRSAMEIRAQQGGPADFDWCRQKSKGGFGIYMAGDDAVDWMHTAFTSAEFARNKSAFRVIAYRNDTAQRVNRLVRSWIYGDTEAPFVPGELVTTRKPIVGMVEEQRVQFYVTNAEMIVTSIAPDTLNYHFPAHEVEGGKNLFPDLSVSVPVWRVGLGHPHHARVFVNLPLDKKPVAEITKRLKMEAIYDKRQWPRYFRFIESIGDLRSIYAMTAHCSQGSTFDHVFLDVPDCRGYLEKKRRTLEMQQLLYTAATRPRYSLILISAAGITEDYLTAARASTPAWLKEARKAQ